MILSNVKMRWHYILNNVCVCVCVCVLNNRFKKPLEFVFFYIFLGMNCPFNFKQITREEASTNGASVSISVHIDT